MNLRLGPLADELAGLDHPAHPWPRSTGVVLCRSLGLSLVGLSCKAIYQSLWVF